MEDQRAATPAVGDPELLIDRKPLRTRAYAERPFEEAAFPVE
jgi:hypothetical protein